MTKPIVVCADDFSMDAGVSEGIIVLIQKGRVSATSAMVLSPTWVSDARALSEYRDQVDVGLHLDFTSEFALQTSFGERLPLLMLKSALRMLNAVQVREHVRQQLDIFEDHWGAAPDHVDGHQHVHQFPVIREALLQECKKRYARRMPWLRWSYPVRASSSLKRKVITAWGGDAIVGLAKEARIPVSGGLLGVYDFDAESGVYSNHMQDWLGHVQSGSLLMCHPASKHNASDAINAARMQEFAYLSSERFAQDLASAQCEIVRGTSVYRDFSQAESVQT